MLQRLRAQFVILYHTASQHLPCVYALRYSADVPPLSLGGKPRRALADDIATTCCSKDECLADLSRHDIHDEIAICAGLGVILGECCLGAP